MRTFIHREYAFYEENGNVEYVEGDIQITFMENNYINVLISRLHNGSSGVNALMVIKYAQELELYDIAKTILQKIYDDLYSDDNYKDFIISFNHSGEPPKIWNIDKEIKTNWGGDIWLPFTRENTEKYITVEKQYEGFNKSRIDGSEYKKRPIIIRGEVDASGVFTYDYPIIGTDETIKKYNESRRKNV